MITTFIDADGAPVAINPDFVASAKKTTDGHGREGTILEMAGGGVRFMFIAEPFSHVVARLQTASRQEYP